MRKLLNTLFITSEEAYLSLDGENVVVNLTETEKRLFPLHTLETIVSFSYKGASPALMGKCAEKEIQLSFFSPRGKYLTSVTGNTNGNVLLRREQYRIADDELRSLRFAKAFVTGKLYNSRYLLLKFSRDHSLRLNTDVLRKASEELKSYSIKTMEAAAADEIRGYEGLAARCYFNVFSELILQNKEKFPFTGRNRRPPMDNVNALLSFAYTLLANDCGAALHSAGLDPYVGFIHTDRSGRKSLALDLMENLRSVFADRFVLTLINNRIITGDDFEKQESGAVSLKDDARKKFLSEWQKRKQEQLVHPFLQVKIPWGLVPYVQSMMLARCIRGDIDEYPPFFWK